MISAISTTGLVKNFGSTRALDRLDLVVRTGEVHGFLGPNGAGKTTTIRILLGLLRKDAGAVGVLGRDPWRDAVALHRRLAYVPGEVNLWPNLTGGEVIDLLGKLRGGIDRGRREALLERFQLDPTKQCRAYSKGNRQKVALVAAFASDVELYLLDEPSSGLDPLMEATFQDVVRELRDAGRTVLLSSHILAEVEALCDRVTIIRAGRAAETGTFDELRHLTRTSVTVETARPLDALRRMPGVYDLRVDHTRARFSVDTPELNRRAGAAGRLRRAVARRAPRRRSRSCSCATTETSPRTPTPSCSRRDEGVERVRRIDRAGAPARPVQAFRVRARTSDPVGWDAGRGGRTAVPGARRGDRDLRPHSRRPDLRRRVRRQRRRHGADPRLRGARGPRRADERAGRRAPHPLRTRRRGAPNWSAPPPSAGTPRSPPPLSSPSPPMSRWRCCSAWRAS